MLRLTLLTCAFALGTFAAQIPIYGEEPFLHPETSPISISSDVHTTITHASLPNHSVRIKNTTGFCDVTKSYTGYLDNGSRHIFFYFFESRRNPDLDDLTLWTNGGPGCSSEMGLLYVSYSFTGILSSWKLICWASMELGPCKIAKGANSTELNSYSWTETSNMIFIDQPVNVGFSYSTHGLVVDTTEQAAIDVHAFLLLFMETFPSFTGRPFHLSGESYGGRYLPVFASEIIHQNSLLKKSMANQAINLQSVLIGNGLTDVVSMTTSYYDQACTKLSGLGKPIMNIRQCIQMQQVVKRCNVWLDKVCRTKNEQPDCSIAMSFCAEALEEPFIEAQINPYDISKPCTTLRENLCYPETDIIAEYLDKPHVREMLGVDHHVGKYFGCNGKVGAAFHAKSDSLAPTFYHLNALLENGIKVLIYVGTWDWICNFIGNYRMVAALEWSGAAKFNALRPKDWFIPTINTTTSEDYGLTPRTGLTKSFGGLTWATIEKAGHMVPYDQPQAASVLFGKWLAGEKLA